MANRRVKIAVLIVANLGALWLNAAILDRYGKLRWETIPEVYGAIRDRGFAGLGPWERPIQSARLSDLSTIDHTHCGPTCPERGR